MAAAGELEKQAGKLDDASISTGGEAQLSDAAASKRGGWITFPFIAGLSLLSFINCVISLIFELSLSFPNNLVLMLGFCFRDCDVHATC